MPNNKMLTLSLIKYYYYPIFEFSYDTDRD